MNRLVATILFASVVSASAEPIAPQELYIAGKYQAAIDAGVKQGSASGLAVAAHAALAEAILQAPCLACVEQAEGLARRAIALDTKSVEGRLYLAVAIGYEARIRGPLRARIQRLAEQAKTNLDAAHAANPGNARVLAALGGWNIAVVTTAGITLGRWLYGASLSEGMRDFERAIQAAPQDLALPYQYALSLSAYDAVAYRNEIKTALSRVIGGSPATALDFVMQTRARKLLGLQTTDSEGYRQLVRQYQGYPPSPDTTAKP